ncbi:hypothetical protein [Aldersonia kunmingensis]|uniref:hypothetical protein n=1 Tax=Aldersonia kunmingensis TaxID=408066 RepID=UPI00082B281C|nr:hypothetical protein [Aldersonia kunmingensis]
MIRIVAVGVLVLVLVEIVVVGGPAREWVFVAGALVLAVVLAVLRVGVGSGGAPATGVAPDPTPDEAMERWRDRTRMQLAWADGTRGDWDRHLRPMLARDFQLALGRRFDTAGPSGANSLKTAGTMMFGDELWQWVDPSAIASEDRDRPGPGREVLEDILVRLEHM